MTTEKIDAQDLFEAVDETTSAFLNVLTAFDERQINEVPFEGSWTAAQVADHVTQSNRSMIETLSKEGKPTSRNIDEGVAKLRDLFLNFDAKLQSPKFILPTQTIYERTVIINNLQDSIEKIKELSKSVDLIENVTHRVFGDVTKLEILHFIVYHTQRHIHQLKNIFKKVSSK